MKRKNSNDSPWRAAGLVTALGFDVVICTVAGYVIGKWAGIQLGSEKSWMIGGVFVGFSIGILTAALLVKKFLEDKQ